MKHQGCKIKGASGQWVWERCPICGGKTHNPACQAKLDPAHDCCEARHKALHQAGKRVGLQRPDLPMWDPSRPTWGAIPV